jgi:RNase P subunit RPR2
MIEVNVPFPDIETNCPSCNSDVLAAGYEFEPRYHTAMAHCVAYCESCDQEFRVIVGGDL